MLVHFKVLYLALNYPASSKNKYLNWIEQKYIIQKPVLIFQYNYSYFHSGSSDAECYTTRRQHFLMIPSHFPAPSTPPPRRVIDVVSLMDLIPSLESTVVDPRGVMVKFRAVFESLCLRWGGFSLLRCSSFRNSVRRPQARDHPHAASRIYRQ